MPKANKKEDIEAENEDRNTEAVTDDCVPKATDDSVPKLGTKANLLKNV